MPIVSFSNYDNGGCDNLLTGRASVSESLNLLRNHERRWQQIRTENHEAM